MLDTRRKSALYSAARLVSVCAIAGALSFYAGQCFYRSRAEKGNRQELLPPSPFSRGVYKISSENKIEFIDGLVFRCEDTETANTASMRMDWAIDRAPKTNTNKDKARLARIELYETIKDGIIYRHEMGLPPKK
jgi:hypothetical protein